MLVRVEETKPLSPAAARKLHSKRRPELVPSWCHRSKTSLEWAGEREHVSLRQKGLKRSALLPPDFILWC